MSDKNFYNLIYSKKNKLNHKNKNLFVGKWLNEQLSEKKISTNLFYEYHWLDQKKQLRDFKNVKIIYEKVLKILSHNLNNFHSINFKERQWEIILWFFLSHYVYLVYDRWNIIKDIKKKYKLKPIQLLSFNPESFRCNQTGDILDLIFSDNWNDWIFSEIIKEQNLDYYIYKSFKKNSILKKKSKKKIYNKKLIKINNHNQFFFYNLELPFNQKIILNISMKQYRFLYDKLELNDDIANKLFKRNLKEHKSKDKFLNFLIGNLNNILPRSIIENFSIIENLIKRSNWPRNPKLIATSYAHYGDDFFKVYLAKKIENETKFVILQHGHQGHHNFCGTIFENKICDKYLSWGNKSNTRKTIPLFVSTNIGKKIIKKQPKGILVKITEFSLIPWRSNHSPRDIESSKVYRKNILKFLNSLNENTRKMTSIKSFDYYDLNYVGKEIKKNFKKIKLNKIKSLSRRGFKDAENKELIIETFNSTGLLELLSMNSPVILLATKNFFNIKKEYRKYYDSLIKNKIIFLDPKKAGLYVNSIYSKIDIWWNETKRQKSIKFFCENMCKYEKNTFNKLPLILKKIANKN